MTSVVLTEEFAKHIFREHNKMEDPLVHRGADLGDGELGDQKRETSISGNAIFPSLETVQLCQKKMRVKGIIHVREVLGRECNRQR